MLAARLGERVDAAMRLARRLGGEEVVLRGHAIADELLAWADREGVGQIIVGRTRERPIARRTLAMLADLAEKYESKTIEFVSAYRVQAGESATSPHRDARAIDFRIRGTKLTEVRDYLWRKYTDVGVGWYPSEQFIHMDTRPQIHDTAWTFMSGENHYHPYWAEVARRPAKDAPTVRPSHRPGV